MSLLRQQPGGVRSWPIADIGETKRCTFFRAAVPRLHPLSRSLRAATSWSSRTPYFRVGSVFL